MGEVYFRISQHLHKPVSEVIREKFTPDIRILIFKYSAIIREEQKQIEEIKKSK